MLEPLEEIADARHHATKMNDPMADLCVLATVDAEGLPSARVLVLREISREGIEVMVSALSPKYRALEATGHYELVLFWKSVGRQFRLRGRYTVLPPEEGQKYWDHKRHTSKLLEYFYEEIQEQSTPMAERTVLVDGIDGLKKRFPDPAAIPIPESARVIRFEPTRIELWTGSEKDRLHRRWEATRDAGEDGWSRRMLVP